MTRGAKARSELSAEKKREGAEFEAATAVAKQVHQHREPAIPEDQTEKAEDEAADGEGPGAANRESDEDEDGDEGGPAAGSSEAAEHVGEGGEADAGPVPVVIIEPGLVGICGGVPQIGFPANHAVKAVSEEKKSGETKKRCDKDDERIRRMLFCRQRIGGDQVRAHPGSHERQTKKR